MPGRSDRLRIVSGAAQIRLVGHSVSCSRTGNKSLGRAEGFNFTHHQRPSPLSSDCSQRRLSRERDGPVAARRAFKAVCSGGQKRRNFAAQVSLLACSTVDSHMREAINTPPTASLFALACRLSISCYMLLNLSASRMIIRRRINS